MSIKVFYSNLSIKQSTNRSQEEIDEDIKKVKTLMRRDSSWGTFVENLRAAYLTCGRHLKGNCSDTQPNLVNIGDRGPAETNFYLDFPSSNFNFRDESVDHFIGVVAGGIILQPEIQDIEVSNFEFSHSSDYDYFPGPNVGIDRLYRSFLADTLGGSKRPILAFTMKPRFGINVSDVVKLYEAAARAGVDIVEDDERLLNPLSCSIDDRVKAVSDVIRRGKYKSIYSVNITGDSEFALRKLEVCAKHSIKMVKIDVLACGFETLRKVATRIRDAHNSDIAITVYPDAYGAYRKLSRPFILRLARLCGADIIYAGSPISSRYAGEANIKIGIDTVHERHAILKERISRAPHIKSTLPTITNDQHPSIAEGIIKGFRKYQANHNQYGFFIGGGISGFPDSTNSIDIEAAVRFWLSVIGHASSQRLDSYVPMNYDSYDRDFRLIGWGPIDVREI